MKTSDYTAIIAAVGSLAFLVYPRHAADNKDDRLSAIIGKMVRCNLRYPPGRMASFIHQDSRLSPEDIFSDLSSHTWADLNDKERFELMVMALLYCRMGEGDLTSLKILADADSYYAIQGLRSLDKNEIVDRTGWSDKEYDLFVDRLNYLSENPEKRK